MNTCQASEPVKIKRQRSQNLFNRMALSTQEFKEIGSQMDVMRHFIRQHPQRATELFRQCPELHEQIKNIVATLREMQQDVTVVESSRNKFV